MASPDVAYIGIDIGAAATKCSSRSGQILRNELGGVTTTTMLGFPARSWRLIGESAVATHAANARNTVMHLPRLLGRPHARVVAEDAHILRYHMFPLAAPADPAAEEPQVPLTLLMEQQQQQQQPGSNGSGSGSEGQERLYSPTELAGMLIGTLKGYQLVEGEDAPQRKFAFAVPKAFPPAHAQALLDAAQIAGLGPEDVMVTTATDALLATYRQKHPAAEFAPAAEGEAEAAAGGGGGGGGGGKTILLVDVGYAQTAIVVFSMGAEGFPRVLGEAYDAALGASNFDHRLFGHFAGEIAKKYGAEGGAVAPGSKKALRLLGGVEKIKKLLSTIPVAQTQVENVVEGRDIDLHITREAFQALVEPEVARFRALVAQALEAAGVGQGGGGELAAVEITGGAMRMPALQEAVAQAAGFTAKPLGLKLDDNAVAYGAALLLAGGPVGAPVGLAAAAVAEDDGNGSEEAAAAAGPSLLLRGPGGTLGAERVAALAAEEAARRAQDEELHLLAGVKNELESFVLELRGMAGHGKHGALVDGAKVGAYADGLEEWLYSDEADAASLADARAKLEAARAEGGGLCQSYYDAVAKDKADYEKALEEEAKKAESEREAEGGDGGDDHDTRRLKKGDRMRMVVKNKEEGNELFSGGNYKPAAARYVKALTHASKLFDLGPEDEDEVRKVKVGLYSNVALCYFKMGNLDATIRNCDEALKLEASNAKVLYRRAAALEAKKLFDEAEKDLAQALQSAPEDKAVLALQARVQAQIKRQLQKEKNMWSKAFS